jgi:enoyl-CoA hydratase/carnithine racemase
VSEVVLKTVEEGVAVLTLNRPERLNAWTQEMEQDYFALLEEAGASREVRAIVVTGAGRGFCAGADMQDLSDLGNNGVDGEARARERKPQSLPHTIEKPIIAAINGPCAGIGLVQALMCDIRFAAEDAKFTTAFARRGLVAEHGIGWILPRLIGPARALDLLLSARVILGAEAASIGLVNAAMPKDELMEHTLAYARELATQCSPASMASMKRQVYGDLERGLIEGTHAADLEMLASFTAPDFAEGVQSFIEKRAPDFAPVGA